MEVQRPVILLVENDYADVFMFRRALSCAGFSGTVRVVAGVTEAVSYLTHTGDHTDPDYHPTPDLIVCDLKLCASTGTELLRWIRSEPRFSSIPVVMLSGSSVAADRIRAKELGACAFLLKSGDISEMTLCVRAILASIQAGTPTLLDAMEVMQQSSVSTADR